MALYPPKVLFAAGGTGGHIFPAIAVAQELRRRRPDVEIAFVGTRRRMESELAPKAGFRFIPISGVGFPRGLSWRWFPALWTLSGSMLQALWTVRRERPLAVFGTGGYVCGPIMAAAAFAGVPTIVHESNAAAGTANRWLGKMAREAHVAFEQAASDFPPKKTRVTGNPIRAEIVEAGRKRVERLGAERAGPPTLLALGGSLGAASLNSAVLEALPGVEALGARVIHQTGRDDFERVKAGYLERTGAARFNLSEAGAELHAVVPFIERMDEAYSQADLALSRSGALTVSELTLCGLPSILVPLPIAKTSGEFRNARVVSDAGGGFTVADADMSGGKLLELLTDMLSDPERLMEMSRRSASIARPDATGDLASAIETYLNSAPGRVVEERVETSGAEERGGQEEGAHAG